MIFIFCFYYSFQFLRRSNMDRKMSSKDCCEVKQVAVSTLQEKQYLAKQQTENKTPREIINMDRKNELKRLL